MKKLNNNDEKKKQQKNLRETQIAQGLDPKSHASHSNATSSYQTIKEEQEGRTDAVTKQMGVIKAQLPQLLKRLNNITDPRNPKK